MTITLLLDLDDTLLGNSQQAFIPAYLTALGQHLAPYVNPDKMVPALLAATRQMMVAGTAERTLEDTFSNAFYPTLGLDRTAIRPTLEDFYTYQYPRLRTMTHPRPEAIELVNQALGRGYRVGISTSPLFPRTATLQRLEWAGLSLREYPFELVSTFETFHFAKPEPAYFTEFLAQIGWPEGPVVVVGDDIKMDVLPAQECGLAVFWTPAEASPNWELPSPPPPQGKLSDVLAWLDQTPLESLVPNLSQPAALKAVLRSTPAALDTITQRIDSLQWNIRPASKEWCAAEIICHLRDVEQEVNLPRLQLSLAESNPFIAGKNTDSWAEERGYIHQRLPLALRAFQSHRSQLLDLLDSISEQDWQRSIRHAIFGPTTFQELVRIIADHDRLHIQQLFRSIAA
ncbi:MAG: DinB family protein [Anaerolineales bacterium]|nr:DinB family protein [Anaerolineales bacterium]